MTIIQEIFADHYKEILYTLHPRATEIENIENLNRFISNFKEKYINKKLNKGFYQNLIPKMNNIELLKNLYWQRVKNKVELFGKKFDIPL